MITWFFGLDQAAQAGIASGIVTSFVIGVVAVLGFWITLRTSTAANREIAEVTKNAKLEELQHMSRIKIADYRVDWIEQFRRDVAALYKVQYEIASIKSKKLSDRTPSERERARQLYYESSELKTRLLLRLKQNSNVAAEQQLEALLKRAVKKDPDEAFDQRSNIRELTRSVLRTEWKRVLDDIHPLRKES
jgi:hypothetical protein